VCASVCFHIKVICKCHFHHLMIVDVDRWTCKHFGHEKLSVKARQTGKRPNQAIMPSGCKMSIYMSFDNIRHQYVIKKAVTSHNHPHGPELYKQYHENRLPQGELQQQTINLLEHGANPTLVADSLNRQGMATRTRDLYNLKQKLKFKGNTCRIYHVIYAFLVVGSE